VLTFLEISIALIVLGAFVAVWRREGDDPLWLARWNGLSVAERARIAAAARSGELLPSQDEVELAAGFARRDRRRRRPSRLIAAIDAPVGLVVLLGGIVVGSGVFIVFGALILGFALIRLARARRVNRRLRETISRGRGY
jgi:Flp pilus assembly protein TadB